MISNYPFGKKNDRPNYYYTQDVYSDGQGITGRMKKRKNKNVRIRKIKKLLNIDNNAKTVKGQKYGFITAILYLAPSTQSGFNVCPQASNGCKNACLYSAGHGAFDSVKQGRINKTRWYIQERKTFLDKLRKEIDAFIVKAKAKKLTPCIRLNGTSDISWENTGLIEEYKSIQWYDYTKIYKRALKFVNGQLPKNYHLTYSLNEDNKKQAFDILKKGGNISAVFRKDLPRKFNGYKVINADQNDLRFLDGHNIIAGLVAKGKAKKIIRGLCLMCELVIKTAIDNGDIKMSSIENDNLLENLYEKYLDLGYSEELSRELAFEELSNLV